MFLGVGSVFHRRYHTHTSRKLTDTFSFSSSCGEKNENRFYLEMLNGEWTMDQCDKHTIIILSVFHMLSQLRDQWSMSLFQDVPLVEINLHCIYAHAM